RTTPMGPRPRSSRPPPRGSLIAPDTSRRRSRGTRLRRPHERHAVDHMIAMRSPRGYPWTWVAIGIASVVAVPIAAVVSSLARPRVEVWLHLWRTQLVELVLNTLLLLAGVGAGTLVIGAALAWLVVHYRFPGRGLFEWALILPLAVPAYVIGFAFMGLFDFAGPFQSALRRGL